MASSQAIRRVRRVSQTLFFLLFLWLLLATFYHGVVEEGEAVADSIPYPVSIFLEFDPLVALASLLSTGALAAGLFGALFVLVATFFFGRWFCGWICPFGAVHNVFSESFRRKKLAKIRMNRTGRHQTVKYVLLVALLVSALTGTLLVGLLDPICFLIRSLGLSVLPAVDTVARKAVDVLPRAAAESTHRFLDARFLGPLPHRFYAGWFLGGLFVTVVALNLWMPRLWCRVLCPLGALLGLVSRFSIFGLHKHPKLCKDCDLCLHACQGAAAPEHGTKWRPSECFVCWNCAAACPTGGGLEFKFGIQRETTNSKPDFSRRGFLASAALGVAALPLLRAAHDPEKDAGPAAIRPPGASPEPDFLERCIRCGQCMKVCPNNALHPALLQAGFEGLWTPVVVPRIGYCEPSCTLCSAVCPTGAIRPFTAEDKRANRVRIGTAFFDRGRCLPWAMARNCMVCEEFCPTSPKSIWFEKATLQRPDGTVLELSRPHVDPSICTGCGVCEHVCPVADQAAIRVTSVGESRSSKNRILLRERPRESG